MTMAESSADRNRSAARRVFGDDRLGVLRAIGRDVTDRLFDAVDRAHRDDRVEIFGAPILFGRRFRARIVRAHARIAADFAARIREVVQDRRQMRADDACIDQHRLGRAANAGAAHLAVQHQRARFREIGLLVHIGVADAFEMREHGHARFVLHARDQALAAARHDQLDGAAETGEHVADRRAIGRRHELNRRGRQSRRLEPFDDRRMQRARGMERLRAAAQDRRVAGLDAERARIGGHVRAGSRR